MAINTLCSSHFIFDIFLVFSQNFAKVVIIHRNANVNVK